MRWAESEAAYRRALALEPANHQARQDLGMLLLSLGRLREGWPLYEARLALRHPAHGYGTPQVDCPRWQGESLQGRSLLVWPEQGFGDLIQFIRYARVLKSQGLSRLSVVCAKPLQRLLRTVPGVDAVAGSVDSLAAHDYWTFALSLPLCAGTQTATFAADLPYLRASPEDILRWRDRLSGDGLRVGLVWKGSATHGNDANRSLPSVRALAPLWSAAGVRFISLQKGAGEDEAQAPPAGQPLLAIGHQLDDFADTAAAIAALDLVITVDTATAHLAGAMGKPCWVLLAAPADWRWMLGLDDSPWYPGVVRLFRQSQPGDWDPVVAQVAQALSARARQPGGTPHLGAAAARLARSGRTQEAEAAYHEAIARSPKDPRLHNNLGNLLLEGRRLDEAEAAYRRALQVRPGDAKALHNLANLLRMTGRPAPAEPLLRQALERAPDLPECWVNLGAVLADLDRPAEAQAAYRRAIALAPQHAQAHVNLGFLLLSLGQLAQGWPLVEARHWPQMARSQSPAPTVPWPQWQGEPLAGKSLLVWPEQGLGDCIQFARFAAGLKQRGLRHLTLVCPAPLQPLLRTVPQVDAVITPQDALPAHDFWAFMMSLPLHLGTTLANLPAQLPYVHADPARVAALRPHLPPGPRVGLVWKGSARHENDAQRSLAGLFVLKPLWRVAGISMLSLQQDFGPAQMANLPADQPMLALGPSLRDFADTAAVVAELDLVICVDTSIAHLAGAMGKPCWILLPAAATDWRWMRGRDDSPWYPGAVRLFRQRIAGDWDEVIDRVAVALRAWAAPAPGAHRASGQPVLQGGKLSLRVPLADDAAASYREGVALHNSGKPEQAEACYRRALQLRPGYAAAYNNLGVLLQARRRWKEAESAYRQAIALGHEGGAAHNNLGNLLADTQRLSQAEASFREALRTEDTAAAHNNLGNLLLETGRVEQAQQAFERAIALRPDDAGAHVNLGNLLCRLQRWDEAHATLQRAIALAPSAGAFINLGVLHRHRHQWADAEAAYRSALAIEPENASARMNLGFLLLATGRLAQGWLLHEARYAPQRLQSDSKPPRVSWPQWQGEPLQGKSLVLWPEQGHGDWIQFVRFVPLLRERGVRQLTIVCPASLQRLLRAMPGVDAVVTESSSLAPHDFWSFPLSLPLHLHTTLDNLPAQLPYLQADPRWALPWLERLPTGPKAGLVWKGATAHKNDANRSLPGLATLGPLWRVPGWQFVSLQKGAGEEEASTPPPGQPLVALGHQLQDFADTAAVISQLDLVICVDTAVAHLAGALGKPVWVLLPAVGTDWRWMLDRSDSPWYPGVMRLFRQERPGDWGTLANQVAQALQALASPAPATGSHAGVADPADANAWNACGLEHLHQRRLEQAEEAFRRGLEQRPDSLPILLNLGRTMQAARRWDEAHAIYARVLAQAPRNPAVHLNLGFLHQARRNFDQAEDAYRAALALNPDYAKAKVNLAILLLQAGDFAQAWPLYEARHALIGRTVPPRGATGLAWEGQPLAGKSLVLWPEQGFGDCIQFVRYARLLRQMGLARLVVVCPPLLHALLQGASGVDDTVVEGSAVPEADYWCFMGSLPRWTGHGSDSSASTLPYLATDPARSAHWARLLPPGRKVGIAWKGTPGHPNDLERSLPSLAVLAPLWQVPGWQFVSLQKGAGEEEAGHPPPEQPLEALGHLLQDFADTAAAISQLDLVICVDTAVAHVAGALGKPVWVLLPAVHTDWRWLREREDSPWYPGVMRLFRQRVPGDWAEVTERVEAALRAWAGPGPVPVHAGPALLAETQDLTPSESALREALHTQGTAAAYNDLGNLLLGTGRALEAVVTYQEALRRDPQLAAVCCNLGNALRQAGLVAQSEAMFRRAIDMQPDLAVAHSDLGDLLRAGGRLAEAEPLLRHAVALQPGLAPGWTNLGLLLENQQRWTEAQASYRRAIAERPDSVQPRLNLGLLLLKLGDYAQGWVFNEARYAAGRKRPNAAAPPVAWPQWQGEPLQGQSLLIWPEQGFGDAIQFVRLAQVLRQRGAGRITWVCRPALVPLLMTASGIDQVLAEGEPLGTHDLWSFPMSLALHLGITTDTIPAQLPYLRTTPECVARWKPSLPTEGLRVGLVWQGEPAHVNDSHRSLPGLPSLAALWEVPGLQFVSLQKGAAAQEASTPPPGQPLVALGHQLQDFADTAAVVSQLDLVICVDTAVAHLAGALGKPVWVLLPAVGSDWRWMLDRSDSPWYPQVMRLFRQPTPGRWDALVGQVAQALAQFQPMTATAASRPSSHLAHLLGQTGRHPEALVAWRAVLAEAPGNVAAWNNLGVQAMALGRHEEAQAAFARAIELQPNHAGAHLNLGTLQRSQRHWDQAEQAYRAAAALAPDKVDGALNLAGLLHALGRLAPAQQAYSQVLALQPDNAQAQCGLAMVRLARGNFEEGWPLFEARERAWDKLSPARPPRSAGARWQGEPLAGRSIVVWHEQGMGDAIQFVRYAVMLKSRGASRVTVASPLPLCPLLSTAPGVDSAQALSDPLAPHDFWCHPLDLPRWLGTRLENLPADLPYLAVDPARAAHWGNRLPAGPQRRVGLVWKGAPGHANDGERSLPGLATLAPLWQPSGPVFISLQKGAGEQEALAPPASQPLLALGHEVRDFADLAAVVSQLDLVICVDTAVAHLAGALAKPVWVLLPAVGTDWRWLQEREDSPWYPGVMRLFRQTPGQDWPSVVAAVAAALRDVASLGTQAKPVARRARKPRAG
jgi:tetratricopeptide (TPR) repeat protein